MINTTGVYDPSAYLYNNDAINKNGTSPIIVLGSIPTPPNPPAESPISYGPAYYYYTILEGANQTIAPGAALQVRVEAPYSDFTDNGRIVRVNGMQLPAIGFTSWAGNTCIKLLPAYTRTLAAGTHTLSVEFSGGVANITFTVDGSAQTNPETGANDVVAAAAALALIAGAAGTVLLRRRK